MSALTDFQAAIATFVAAAATYATSGGSPALEVTSTNYTARVNGTVLVGVNSTVVDTPANIVTDFNTKLNAYTATLLDKSAPIAVSPFNLLMAGGQLVQMRRGG